MSEELSIKISAQIEELQKKLGETTESKDALQKELDNKAVLKAIVETQAQTKELNLEPTIANMLKVRNGLLNK